MNRLSNIFVLLVPAMMFLSIIAIGCSINGDGGPTVPSDGKSLDAMDTHYLWGYWTIALDEKSGAQVIPMREVSVHWNVIGFLEQSPCTDCLQVTKLLWPAGEVEATIQLRHPFPGGDEFTGFDVRGICFLPGTFQLPLLNHTIPNFGVENYLEPIQGVYLGYTNMFNPVTYPEGLPFGYAKGKLTGWPKDMLTASLGAFQYYTSTPDVRNAFRTFSVLSNVYHIKLVEPGPLVFGYAVDASWEEPTKPVVFPDSFGPYANCLEAWKAELEVDDSALTADGGYLKVTAVAYDHQGSSTIFGASLECPELTPDLIMGDATAESPESRTYEFIVPNDNLTAVAGDTVNFVVMISPIEKIALWGFNASTATVHESSSECPKGVHSVCFGEGEFLPFGNWLNLQTDAAILTQGDYTGEFIMFGNGFAGSMMGSYYIGDLGPNESHGLVGLVGVGAPSSLDVSPVYGNIFLVMPYDNTEIKIYRSDAAGLPSVMTPNGAPVNSLDVTPDEDIWFIEQDGAACYLHHAVAIAEWSWAVVKDDSQQILSELPSTPQVFDLIYEPNTQRLYIYHNAANGSITVYDASQAGPPTEIPALSKQAIWGYSGPLKIFDGAYFFAGADIELDNVDADLSDCRIVVFANFELGGSSVMKFDADMNVLDTASIDNGPFLTFAISIDPNLTLRRLVFLPLTQLYEDNYFLFDPPADW